MGHRVRWMDQDQDQQQVQEQVSSVEIDWQSAAVREIGKVVPGIGLVGWARAVGR